MIKNRSNERERERESFVESRVFKLIAHAREILQLAF